MKTPPDTGTSAGRSTRPQDRASNLPPREVPQTPPLGSDQLTTPLDGPISSEAPRSGDAALLTLQQRYDILGEVGRGGMGIVYKARDRETDEIVALKVLKPEIAARPEVVERFKAELRLARKITHKNVCRIYELLRFDDTVAIAMEYVEGESLRSFLARYGSAPLRRGLAWAGEICAGLGEAHAQGIVHRDLKPENILIDRQSNVKVMDFGIARSIESEAAQTATLIGTPAYMSPEQAQGKPPDSRSDIYALGLVLYEMFAGQPAFHADTPVAYALKQIREPPPPAHSVEPYIPGFLDRGIQKCLEKDPRRRFQSAAELQAALGEKEVSEAKAAGPEVPLRLSMARGSDAMLLVLGAVGLAAFIILAPQVIPEMGMRVRLTREMLYEKARDEVTRRGWNPYPKTWLHLEADKGPYNFLAEKAGYAEARSRLSQEFPPYLYNIRYHEAGELNPTGEGMPGVVYEPSGSLRSIELPVVRWIPQGPGLPRPEALELAKKEIQQSFGTDTGQLTPESEGTLNQEGRHGYTFQWVKREPSGISWHYQADIYDRPTLLKRWDTLPESYRPPRPTLNELIVNIAWILLAAILFFSKRLFSQLRLREAIVLGAAGAAVGIALGVSMPLPEIFMVIFMIPFLCGFFILYFLLLSMTATFLAQRPWPHLTTSYSALIQFKPSAQTAGLALARGIACGLVLQGLTSLLLRLGVFAHVTRPPLMQAYGQELNSFLPFLTCLAIPLAAGLGSAYALVFFLSLARRKTARPLILACLGGLINVAMESVHLPPDWFQMFSTFLVGAALSLVLVGFDMLTVVAAAFTLTLWQTAYPLTQIFETVGNWQYWFPLILWAGIFAWAIFAAFRPTWARLGRRVAEMSE